MSRQTKIAKLLSVRYDELTDLFHDEGKKCSGEFTTNFQIVKVSTDMKFEITVSGPLGSIPGF